MARFAGWPVLAGMWIIIALQFPLSAHFSGGFFRNLLDMGSNKELVWWFDLVFLSIAACFTFFGDGMGNCLLTPLSKGPDWTRPLSLYIGSMIALIFWIAEHGAMRIAMLYWVSGVVMGLLFVSSILECIVPQTISPPVAPPRTNIERGPIGIGGTQAISPWTNLLHGWRADLWPKYMEEARAAGQDGLADAIQVMLGRTEQRRRNEGE